MRQIRKPNLQTSRAERATATRGTVTAVEGERVWVSIPRWFHDKPAGPFQTVAATPPVAVGDRVLVVAVDGDADDLIVVGTLLG